MVDGWLPLATVKSIQSVYTHTLRSSITLHTPTSVLWPGYGSRVLWGIPVVTALVACIYGEEVWYWGEGLNVKQDHFVNNQAVNFVTSCHETTKHSEVLIILVRLKLQDFGHLIEASPGKLEATVLFWVIASQHQFKRQNKLMTYSKNKQVYFYHVHRHKLMTAWNAHCQVKYHLKVLLEQTDVFKDFIKSGGFSLSHKSGCG